MKKCNCENNGSQENYIAFIYIFRNMLNALFGDDPDFRILEVNEPLPDGSIERHEDGETLNIICSDVNKLIILRDKLGECYEDGQKLYIDYYYGSTDNALVNIQNRPTFNNLGTNLDIAMLFEGNPHYSRFFSGWTQMGPVWCVVFKPELIQFFTDDGTSLTGRRSCAMEDIAKMVFPKMEHYKIYFSTENKENFEKSKTQSYSCTLTNTPQTNAWSNTIAAGYY